LLAGDFVLTRKPQDKESDPRQAGHDKKSSVGEQDLALCALNLSHAGHAA
jgi:hypothetical protein